MFTVIGERINTTLKMVQAAVIERNGEFITNDVRRQAEAGATYIDVNAGARIGEEAEDMKWLIDIIQPAIDLPLCLDSPDPDVLEMAYGLVTKKPMINSISLEKSRFEPMIKYLKGKQCRIIALCMDDSGMPKTVDDIVSRATSLVYELENIGIPRDDIFIDPLIQPMSVEKNNCRVAMDAVLTIKTELQGVHTTGGLSNISYGLPQRRIINRHFLTLMMGVGFDSAIMDPLDSRLMACLRTTEMLCGNDDYCMNFIKGVRESKIVS
jgi:cobalamin-dependent methionine synthase I